MSKIDMEDYLPKNVLQDGDNLFATKTIVNNYRTVLYWLLNNSIDHKQMDIDNDTDWDDLDNFSVYHFYSVEGPNAPEENQLGGNEGIVVCTSAGIGDHFQMAFTSGGAAFRSLHSEWFYIGHGIPADVDISKLIDAETLGKILNNYYTKPEINQINNDLLNHIKNNYYNKQEINTFRSNQSLEDSEQNRRITYNFSYEQEISNSASDHISSNASNIAVNSESIKSLSSSTNTRANENSLNALTNSENINSLSDSTSSNSVSDSVGLSSNSNKIDSLSTSTSTDNILQIERTNSLSNSTNTNYIDNSIETSIVSSSANYGIDSNSENIVSLSGSTVTALSSESSTYTSLYNVESSNRVALSKSASSDASVSGAYYNSHYTSFITTTSNYSANASFAGNNNFVYNILGSANNGISPNMTVSKANSLAQLNYNNAMILTSYVYNATHMYSHSTESNGNQFVNNGQTVNDSGQTGIPLKEIVRSNSVSMNSEINSLNGTELNTYPLSNMSIVDNANFQAISTSPINENQYSGEPNALGSIYANASNGNMLASETSLNTSSISSVSSSASSSVQALSNSTSSTFSNSVDPRFNSDESSTTSNRNSLSNSSRSEFTSDETNINNNQTILNDAIGFYNPTTKKAEYAYKIIYEIANGYQTRNAGIPGRFVGLFSVQNPHTQDSSTYNFSQLTFNGNELDSTDKMVGKESLDNFTGADRIKYADTHALNGPTSINFDATTNQIEEHACVPTTSIQDVQSSEVSGLGMKSGALASGISSAANDESNPVYQAISDIVDTATQSVENWVNEQGFKR